VSERGGLTFGYRGNQAMQSLTLVLNQAQEKGAVRADRKDSTVHKLLDEEGIEPTVERSGLKPSAGKGGTFFP